MKLIKKFNLALFSLIAIFSFISVSNAATSKTGQYGEIVIGETRLPLTINGHHSLDAITNLKIVNTTTGKDAGVYFNNGKTGFYYGHYYDNRPSAQGKWHTVYCLDPAAHSDTNRLVAERFLFPENYSPYMGAVDTALVYALKYSTNNYAAKSIAIRTITAFFNAGIKPSTTNLKPNAYMLYAAFFGLAINWVESDSEINSNYKKLYNLNLTPDINELKKGSLKVGSTTYYFNSYIITDYNGSYNDNGSCKENANVCIAKQIFKGAIKKAAEFAEAFNGDRAKIKSKSVDAGQRNPIEVSNPAEEISYRQTHKIVLSGFKNDGKASFAIKNIAFNAGAATVGTTGEPEVIAITLNNIKVYDKESGLGTYRTGDNILKLKTDINYNADIEIGITVEAKATNSDKINCKNSEAEYKIFFKYTDSSLALNPYPDVVGVVWYPEGTNGQRFVSIENPKNLTEEKPAEIEGESIGKMTFKTCDCTEIEQACINSIITNKTDNTEECRLAAEECPLEECTLLDAICKYGSSNTLTQQEACEKFQGTCKVECNTTVSNEFQCCDANNEIVLIKEDKEKLSIKGPENTVACFANSYNTDPKDEAGNSYKQEENKYCRVSCKEDYDFYMPGSRVSQSGRYFTFYMRIEGQKDCYTNKIDTEQFNKDIIDIQTRIIDAYNDYQKWKALAEGDIGGTSPRSYNTSCHCNSHGCGPSCSSSTYDSKWTSSAIVNSWKVISKTDLNNGTVTVVNERVSVTDDELSVDFEYPTGEEDYDCEGGEWQCGTSCVEWDTVTDKDGNEKEVCVDREPDYCSCPGGSSTYYTDIGEYYTADEYREKLRARRDQASRVLTNLKKEYDNIIKLYNDCTDWDNIYNYDPKINYTYEDQLYYDYNIDRKTTMEAVDDSTKEFKSNGDATVWYCTGNLTNGDYSKCSSYSSTIKDKNIKNALVHKPYIVCDTSGCKEDPNAYVYPASYVKKTATVKQSYQPATLFYYIKGSAGEVTTDSSRGDVEPINNGLAIGLGTKRNMYYYGIRITDLGEFYNNSGKLGRLVGSSNSVASTDEFKEDLNFKNGNLTYDCTYLVNMGKVDGITLACDFNKCDGPNCDLTCTGPGCEDQCEGDNCDFTCVSTGCVYNEGVGSSFFERQIKLGDLFPDGTVSRNWNVNGVDGLSEKAQATINEIQTSDESIYESTPILSVTISPSSASNITSYNKEAEKNGGYSNKTLDCYNLNGHVNGACFSSVLTDILDNKKFGIEINENSYLQPQSSIRRVGNVSGNKDEYFVAWKDLSANGSDPSEMIIGPSWK